MNKLVAIIVFILIRIDGFGQIIPYQALPDKDSLLSTDYIPIFRAPDEEGKTTLKWIIKVVGDSLGSSGSSADSTIFQTKYRSDTARVNVYAALNGKQDKGDSATYYTKYRSDTSRSNIYNAINGRLSSVKTINNHTISGSGNLDLFYVRSLSSDFTTTNTTATNTGLSFSIAANEEWVVTITGHAAKATTNTGLKVGIAAPSGATITGTEYRGGAAYSTALTNGEISAINTLGGTFATGTGVKVPFRMEFTITNGSTAGTVELQAATVTSNTATIYAKTRLQAYRVNNPAP